MAANRPKDEIEWNLDWDDLTEGVPPPLPTATPPVAPAPTAPPPVPGAAQPPPARVSFPRAFPTPAATFPDAEPAAIIPPQRLPGRAPTPAAEPPLSSSATPPPLPRIVPAPASPSIPAPAAPGLVRSLVRGQRMRLSEILPGEPPPAFAAGLEIATTPGVTIDLCCFGLDEAGKLADDRYLIFYNQKSSPEGALSVRGTHGEIFRVDLGRLPTTVRRLVFTVTVDGVGSVRALGASRFELHILGGQTAARYEFNGGELEEVKALMVAEIYYKDGWRMAAVGQGFAGGLSELLRHFGGREV